MKSIRKSAKGFTFVELIVVMAIIAVLTATLVMAVGAFLRDKKYDDANAKAESVYRALQIKLNQYDAEGHKVSDSSDLYGVGGVERKNTCIYVGNFSNITQVQDASDYDNDGDVQEVINIGVCTDILDDTGASRSAAGTVDATAFEERAAAPTRVATVKDFDMGDTIRIIYTKKDTANVNWNPSWMAKVNLETYTVEYVLYTEDPVDLSTKFLDKTGTADNDGYYYDAFQQQASDERARLEYYVVGCYPMQAFYN